MEEESLVRCTGSVRIDNKALRDRSDWGRHLIFRDAH